jgi:hypothetical protein
MARWGWVVGVTPLPRFTPGERTPGTHCTGGWVGPRACLDTEDRGKVLSLYRGSNLDRLVVETVARHYTDWATPASVVMRLWGCGINSVCLDVGLMLIMIIIMWTVWDYVSELRPPTGLLVIPQVIYELGEPLWLVHQSSLEIIPAGNLVTKQEDMAK